MTTKKEGTTKKQFKWSPEEARKLAADRSFVHYTISYVVDSNGTISARARKMGSKLKISDTAKKFISIDDKRQKEESKFVEKHSQNVTLDKITEVPNYANDSKAIILNAIPVYNIDEEGHLIPRTTADGSLEVEYARIMGPALAVAFVIYNYYSDSNNLDPKNISTTLYELVDEIIKYGYSEEDLREDSPKNQEFKALINEEKSEKTRTERDDVRAYNKYYAIFGPATRKIETEESSKSGKNVSLASRLIDKYNKLSADGKLQTSYIRVNRHNDKETVTVLDMTKNSVPNNLNRYQELRLVINPTDVDLQDATLEIIKEEAARNPKSVVGRMWEDYVKRGSNVIRGQVRSLAVAGAQPKGRPASTSVRAPTSVAKTGARPPVAAAKAPGRVAPKVGVAARPGATKGALSGTRRAVVTPVSARVAPTSEVEAEPEVQQEPEEQFEEQQGEFPVSEGAGGEEQLVSQ